MQNRIIMFNKIIDVSTVLVQNVLLCCNLYISIYMCVVYYDLCNTINYIYVCR